MKSSVNGVWYDGSSMGIDFVLLSLALGASFIIWLSAWRAGSKVKLPPSPWGFPLVGHLLLLGSESLHIVLQQLSIKLGPIVFLRLGLVPAVAVSNPEIAREVLKTQDASFASRPYVAAGKVFEFKDIALAPYGEHWKSLRKLCMVELFTSRRIASFAWIRREELRCLLSSFRESDRVVVSVREPVAAFTFNIMTRILMSKRYFVSGDSAVVDAEADEFKRITSEIATAAIGFHVSNFVPAWLRWIDWRVREIIRLGALQHQFMQKVVDEHKLSLGKVDDLMDTMLQHVEDELTIKSVITEMISAGTDTSAATIEWALAELLKNPRVLEKAQSEVASVIGNRIVEEEDIQRLEYLQAVVKEVFRLHPPVATLIPHMSIQECKLAGYDVPRGATVFVNVYAIGRDPEIWEDPLEFRPERFVEKKIDVRGQDFELLPFGSGRRACPGISMGLTTVHLALSNLLHAFDWSLVGEQNLEDKFGLITTLKHPLLVKVAPRLEFSRCLKP